MLRSGNSAGARPAWTINFGELLPGTLQGVVYADLDRDCVFDPDEHPIAGVKIELLDDRGSVRGDHLHRTSGEYRFERIVPGQYAVRETQPAGYFQGSQHADRTAATRRWPT